MHADQQRRCRCLGLLLLVVTAAALAATGDLTQPPGTAGCVSELETVPCADGHGLGGPAGVAVSPDGKSVYVASAASSAVARLNRDPMTGAIAQPAGTGGCVSESGAWTCADGHGLGRPRSVAVSPDGKSVYVASPDSDAVARFNRSPATGVITQPAGTAGCVSQTGAGPCADGHGLDGAISVAVSPDGKSVYATSHGAVARFNRNTTTGAITQPAGAAGCVSETGAGPCADGHGLRGARWLAVSPDNKSVYVASRDFVPGPGNSGAVARLVRNTTTGAIAQPAGRTGCVSETGAGTCADGHALVSPNSVAVSPDNKSVYVASENGSAVARFNRNTATGAITQPAGAAGCVSGSYGPEPCADGHGLAGGFSVAVSPDGKSVYVASSSSHAVARLDRDTTTGAITQPAGAAGCISNGDDGDQTCAVGHGLSRPESVAVSPDNKSVYAAAYGSNAVARFNRAP